MTRLLVSLALLLGLTGALQAAPPADPFAGLQDEYAATTLPVLKQFCLKCHSTDLQEGELDLERFTSLTEVRKGTKAWLKVVEMLDNGEMPPKKSPQPTPAQRKQLRDWADRYLKAEGLASAGDPGPVVLRRLNNAEYTYTLRDLTGVPLDPAREFPADSAAGEGFTNAGVALAMSPALLTKYLDAGKEVARHAVLLPDGFRFSPSTTPSDWTNATLARIRDFYREFTDSTGGTQVNLQGIVFDTNSGGRLPVEKYLEVTLVEREAIQSGKKTIAAAAAEHQVNPKYLGILWQTLTRGEPSLVLDGIRARWKTARPDEAISLATDIGRWQQALFRFSSVGHIGKVGGPKAWQESVSPLTSRQELRLKLTPAPDQKEVSLFLVTGDAGDGSEHDFVVWERPRLVAPGRPDLLIKDVRDVTRELLARRTRLFLNVKKCLAAAAEIQASKEPLDLPPLARKHGVELDDLTAWLDVLGIGSGGVTIESHLTQKIPNSAGYDFIQGFGPPTTPIVIANSSDQHVRVPGNMKPHGIAVHPSPPLNVITSWQSPVAETLTVSAKVQHAHPECGNGVTWTLEVRRGNTRQRLAAGTAQGGKEVPVGPFENVAVKPGDLVSLIIGPRDGNHSCDLTAVDLTLKAGNVEWDLAKDVSPNILAGNPHADSHGHEKVWHFYTEPVSGVAETVLPPDSILMRWQTQPAGSKKDDLAEEVEALLELGPPEDKSHPDTILYAKLSSLGGPLLNAARNASAKSAVADAAIPPLNWGVDPALFGKHPDGSALESASLGVKAPATLEIKLPADLAAGTEFVVSGLLHAGTGAEGSVQLQVLTNRPEKDVGLVPSAVTETRANGAWTSNNQRIAHNSPILVNEGTAARKRIEAALTQFRNVFPLALCYVKIVPVDEVVTLTLFYREDDALQRLMLDEAQTARLNRLWDELHYVSRDALTLVDAFQQLLEYASQDGDPKVFEPLRKPIMDRAAAFRQTLLDSEPKHLDALIKFAGQAYRRPLTAADDTELRALYQRLREQELPHAEAFRFTLARVFLSPSFLYRLEQAPAGSQAGAISDWELASRLSYFLWSSQPDAPLRAAAASGTLHQPEVLAAQARRMLKDDRVRRLATEFACQWLQVYDFQSLDEKSETHFPEFKDLRSDMAEETVRFFTDAFQTDASLVSLFDADHTFVNERLAKFYNVPGVTGPEWRRVDGLRKLGRGGVLGMSTTLAKQSGASRTSPILRGNWVSEVLLGEKLPKPPKDVPPLADEESATDALTVRQLIEKHTSDERCSGCHRKIDPFGFALESFDAIGRLRDKDLALRPIDSKTTLPDGAEIEGLPGLRNYLLTVRRDAIVRQFCRKLLGYALGRGVQLSDGPLLDEIQERLKQQGGRLSIAIEAIVQSPQFREIRGRDVPAEEL